MATDEALEATLARLRLFGLLAQIDQVRNEPWLARVLEIEHAERTRRSFVHRTHLAGLGAFKPLCDFDWKWPKKLDRALVDEIFTLRFIAEGANVVLLGPNGVGKTMLLRNLAHRALHDGRAVVVRTASDLLADLRQAGVLDGTCAASRGVRASAPTLHRRSRVLVVRRAPRRPPLRGHHAQVR